MFLKFKKSCVFHGDRSAGEIVEFDVPPRDVSIVIGAGLAEYVNGPEEPASASREASASVDGAERAGDNDSTSASEAEPTAQVEAPPPARPARGQKKAKAKK